MNENVRNSGEAVCKEDERKRKCVEKRRKWGGSVGKCEKMNEKNEKMSRNERNGSDMVGNSGKCRNMMENIGKCSEMRRKTEKDGEKKTISKKVYEMG